MPVPSTPTAGDAMSERKKINDEIAILTQKRDTAQRECEQWTSAKEAIRREIESTTGLVLSTKEYDAILSIDLKGQRDSLRTELQTIEKNHIEKTEDVRQLDIKIVAKTFEHRDLVQAVEDLKTDKDHHQRLATAARLDHQEAKNKKEIDLGDLDRKLKESQTLLDQSILDRQENERKNLVEDARLSRRSSDLAIYEQRIRKMALAVGIDPVTIILQ